MVIAVSTRFLLSGQSEEYGSFLSEVLAHLTRQHAQHQFYLLVDRPLTQSPALAPNITPLVVGSPARSPLLWKYWLDIKLPQTLKKINADVLVAADGVCSLGTKVPQCLVVPHLDFWHHKEAYPRSHRSFYRRYLPKFVKKAAAIITPSALLKTELVQQCKADPQKIGVVYGAAKEGFAPLAAEDQQKVKEKYTEGREYFIYAGSIAPRSNLINLLKAFSVFKKRQKSAMKLVLAGHPESNGEDFLQQLQTYKYREDVVVLQDVEEKELPNLVGAAYALVAPAFNDALGEGAFAALASGVPVLAAQNSVMQELSEEAALYFDPHQPADIAEQLMLIYKDESLRNRLVTQGLAIAAKYSWQQTAEAWWQSIRAAVKQ